MQFYEDKAEEFSKTRGYIWPCVKKYLDNNAYKNNTLIELGCGNGKNIKYAIENGFDIDNIFAIDNSLNLIKICNRVCTNVILGDICKLDFINIQFDNVMCIAVLHHISNEIQRSKVFQNLYNLCKKGGSIIITVWSFEKQYNGKKSRFNKDFNPGDNIVYWKHMDQRYYYIYTEESLVLFLENAQKLLKFEYNLEWEEQNWVITIFKKI